MDMKQISSLLAAVALLCGAGMANGQESELFKATTREKAEQGDAVAQIDLGWMYYEGDGVPQDIVEAAKWFRKAAEQGKDSAQAVLGEMYRKGEGVPQDYAEAVKWFRKAAEQGDAIAQGALGGMYYSGEGVPQNYEEAVKWFRKAAAQGHAKAKERLGEVYYKLGNIDYHIADNYDTDPPGSTGIEKMNRAIKKKEAYVKASKWYLKAANEGHAGAQRKLGMMYHKGEGVPKNDIEAYAWLFLARADEISILEKRITEWQLHNAQKRATELQHLIGAE